MKKSLFLLAIVMGLSASTVFSMNSDPKTGSENPAISDKKENKLSEEEISRISTRIEEIRDIDKSNLTAEEKLELKNELKEYKKELRDNGPYIYVGGGVLLVLIIVLIILLV